MVDDMIDTGHTIKEAVEVNNLPPLILRNNKQKKDWVCTLVKVEKILKGRLDSIPSPSPSVKIQIIGGKVYLR